MGRDNKEADMSDATYVLGTVEYVTLEIACETPGVTFTAADWSAKVTLVELGEVFDDDASPSIWEDAVLEVVGTKTYAKCLLGSVLNPVAGKYRALVRLTKTVGGTEIPLLRARGIVEVVAG
jgi:hypothetical protein